MPAIIRPRNADGSYGQPQKVGQGLTDKEKVEMLQAANEELMYALVELDAQRVEDQRVNELALAELTETLMGGNE